MGRTLLILSVIGILLFTAAFAMSFADPLLVERAAREVVRIEIERRVGEKVEAFSNAKAVTLALKTLGKTNVEIETTRREIAEGVPRKVASVVADMLNADCECRKRLVEYAVRDHDEKLASLGQLRERLVGLIESAYSSVTTSLMREFRIFTASNATAFALLALISYFRRGAALQLALPAVVLVGAAFTVGSLYVFNQNWLHTILYSQYVGLAYMGYLGAAALLLADVAFNRARASTTLFNAALNVVGSAVQAVPC